MLVTGLSLERFREITREISDACYDGNVIVEQEAHALSPTRFRARLRTKESSRKGPHGKECAPGARMSWSGRHIPAACWHAYRDVLEAMFAEYPDARVQTSMATYKGKAGFEEHYPGTAYKNIGGMMQPAYMPELCEC